MKDLIRDEVISIIKDKSAALYWVLIVALEVDLRYRSLYLFISLAELNAMGELKNDFRIKLLSLCLTEYFAEENFGTTIGINVHF